MAEHICNRCCIKFDKPWKLERHINGKRRCKLNTRAENHKCNYCNNNYSSKYYLEKHIKICKQKNNEQKDINNEHHDVNNDNPENSNTNQNVILDEINNSNVSVDSSTNNNNNNNSNIAINSNNITNLNIPNFIYPFGYEDMSYITDDEKLRILTSNRAIIEALKVIYSKPQNCNIYRPNANKDNISFISMDVKNIDNENIQDIISNDDESESESEIIETANSTEEESIHNEPRQDASSFEEDIESETEQEIQRNKHYRKKNIKDKEIKEGNFDISIQSIKYKSIINKLTKNATDFLLRLLHACKYKLTCQDQLCILENIEDNRIHVSRDFYIEYVVNFLEAQFRDIVYKDIFKKYDLMIRKEQNFKTNKLETVKNLIKELERFITDKKQDTIDEDLLTNQIWAEEKENRDDINITDERNNLEENEIELTPRFRFFEDMKELEMKYFSEHGMSIGNLYKYRKILLERAQREVNILSEEYNNQRIKDKIIRKLIKNNTFTLISRLKDIRFINPSRLVSGTDTKRFSKLSFREQNIPDCLINYIKGATEYEGFFNFS
jgi:hypothetical protein